MQGLVMSSHPLPTGPARPGYTRCRCGAEVLRVMEDDPASGRRVEHWLDLYHQPPTWIIVGDIQVGQEKTTVPKVKPSGAYAEHRCKGQEDHRPLGDRGHATAGDP